VPVASAGVGSAYNYATTRCLGEIAKSHFRNRGKGTEELRAIISKSRCYDLVFPAAVKFMANADGQVSSKESELYRAMLTRRSFDEHETADCGLLLADKDNVLEAVARIQDRSMAQALVELVILMGVYDGLLAAEEEDFLRCVGESAGVPLDMEEIAGRAKEYKLVLERNVLDRTVRSAGSATVTAVEAAGHAAGRLRATIVGACRHGSQPKSGDHGTAPLGRQ